MLALPIRQAFVIFLQRCIPTLRSLPKSNYKAEILPFAVNFDTPPGWAKLPYEIAQATNA